VLTSDKSQLFAQRSKLASPKDYVVLPETISKEPLGPVVRNGDDEWLAIVRWTGYAMLNAEEAGITSKNVEAEAKSTKNPDVARLLGADGEYGKDLKVPKDWVVQIVKQVGNYGEVFEKNLGKSTPLEIDRGLNACGTTAAFNTHHQCADGSITRWANRRVMFCSIFPGHFMQNSIGAPKQRLSLSDPKCVRGCSRSSPLWRWSMGWYLFDNTQTNLQHRGITSGFDFLERSAGFGIAQHLIDYTESDTTPGCLSSACSTPCW
jgi:hypothetical protein